MKTSRNYMAPLVLSLALSLPGIAQDKQEERKEAAALPAEETIETKIQRHKDGSGELAIEQDELSGDVQELILLQTSDQVIQLLEEVEALMGEVTDELDTADTDGETIAAETEIIEKIFEAAQQRAAESGGT